MNISNVKIVDIKNLMRLVK